MDDDNQWLIGDHLTRGEPSMTILAPKVADGTQQFQCESQQPQALDTLDKPPNK
jgi:hypothetical protein